MIRPLGYCAFALVLGSLVACPVDHVVGTDDDDAGPDGGDDGLSLLTLTVVQEGTDGGVVVFANGGNACDASCLIPTQTGQALTLDAWRDGRPTVAEWTGACTGFAHDCKFTLNGDAAVVATLRPYNIMFTTPAQYLPWTLGDGDGGVRIADAVCNSAARSRGFQGQYIAWLSTSATNAKDRIPTGVRGWVLPYGTPGNWPYTEMPFMDRLTDGWMFNPASVSPQPAVATGSNDLGGFSGPNCNDWTDADAGSLFRAGNPFRGMPGWADHETLSCDKPASLYCLQIDYGNPIPKMVASGVGLSFVTHDQYPSGGGVAAFDAACAAEASAAGLVGTFRAWVNTAGSGPRVRWNETTWSRLDGPTVLSHWLMNWSALQVTADMRMLVTDERAWPADPSLLVGDTRVWFGSSASTCTDWFSTAGTAPVNRADESLAQQGLTSLPCDQRARLFCFQTE